MRLGDHLLTLTCIYRPTFCFPDKPIWEMTVGIPTVHRYTQLITINPGSSEHDQDNPEDQTKRFRDFHVKNDKDVCNPTRSDPHLIPIPTKGDNHFMTRSSNDPTRLSSYPSLTYERQKKPPAENSDFRTGPRQDRVPFS